MLNPSSERWANIAPPRYAHEKAGQEIVGSVLPDRAPNRVWANFDFEAPDGAFHHVDLLVATGVGLFLVEFADVGGHISGDDQVWRVQPREAGRAYVRANPVPDVRAKARALGELFAVIRPDQQRTPVAGLVVPTEQVRFDRTSSAALHVVRDPQTIDDPDAPSLASALRERRYPGSSRDDLRALSAAAVDQIETAIRDAREAGLIQPADHYRRVGDYRLGELLFAGATYQDFLGQHVSDASRTRRVRRFNVATTADEEKKHKVERAARREYALLSSLDHPGIARVVEFRPTEFGPCLLFSDPPPVAGDPMRLDRFMVDRALSFEQRADLYEQLVSAVRYMHGKGVVHRALSPHAILVLDPDGPAPRLQLFSWQTGARPEGTTSGTGHLQQLLESEAQGFVAPEVARGLPGDETADVFSLGVLAAFFFGGRAPTAQHELHTHIFGNGGLRLSAFADAVSESLEAVVFESTRGAVSERIASVDAFWVRLQDALAQAAEPEPALEEVDPLDARPGTVLGRYTVQRTVGEGGSAVALLVHDADDKPLVLKVPREAAHADRVRDEADLLARLDHPNIVKGHGVEVFADRPCLVVEYAGRDTLRDRLRQEVLGEELLENLGDDLLSALEHIIDAGELHRDLKPANIALRTFGKPERLRLVVFDFSLAGVPRDHTAVGTVDYRDPFLGTEGRRTWDARAEMYAAAVVLYEMATGVRPVWGDGRSAADVLDDAHPTLDAERFDAGIREGLSRFFRTALHRHAAQRYPDLSRMRAAWRHAFEGATTVHAPHESLADTTVQTPVGHLPLSPRAVNTLDRLQIRTVADLLRVPPSRFQFLPGVGSKTRREILEQQARLESFRSEAEALEGPAPRIARPVENLEHFLEILQRGRGTALRTRRAYLGLEPEDRPAGAWPTGAEVGKHVGTTGANVNIHLTKDRAVWSKAEAVTRLRDDLEALLGGLGGVATPLQLGGALLDVWATEVKEHEERLRLACAVARLGVETEMAADHPRYRLHRDTERVLIATDDARVHWARRLGRRADDLADRDPLLHPGAVADALRAIAEDESLPAARLVRLAAAFSARAAVSTIQELYPRGMDAGRALALARNAVLTRGARNQIAPIDPDALRARVAARYPEAAPLPERPALDALVEAAGLPLRWDPKQGRYVPPGTPGLLPTGSFTHVSRTSATFTATVPPPAAQLPPEVREFEAHLGGASEPGAWCVFTVPARYLRAAFDALVARHAPHVVSLDARLLDHLRAFAAERKLPFETLLRADAEPPTSRAGLKLRGVVDAVLPRLEAELLALDLDDRPLLLHEAGLLAHFDRLGVLGAVRAAIAAGDLRARAGWVLIPNDAHSPGAVLDDRSVPTVTSEEVARVPKQWLAHARAAASTDASPPGAPA